MDREALIDRYLRSVVIHGTPERVVDQLRCLRDQIGLDYLMCVPLSHASFLAFTESVMPHLV